MHVCALIHKTGLIPHPSSFLTSFWLSSSSACVSNAESMSAPSTPYILCSSPCSYIESFSRVGREGGTASLQQHTSGVFRATPVPNIRHFPGLSHTNTLQTNTATNLSFTANQN